MGTAGGNYRSVMKITTKAGAFFEGVIGIGALVASILLTFALLSVCLEVILRYFLGQPTIWVVEITEYILLFITFLGAAWVLKREGHVKVDLISNRLNSRAQTFLETVTSIISAIVCLVLAWYTAQLTWDYFQRNVEVIAVFKVPKAPILAIIPLGYFLLFIQFIRRSHGFWVKTSIKS